MLIGPLHVLLFVVLALKVADQLCSQALIPSRRELVPLLARVSAGRRCSV